jgi:mono/diheme cytochrome c family protein
MAALAMAFAAASARAETPAERGRYLVETIAGCGNCHTPRGPGGAFADGKHLAGGFVIDEKPFRAVASNITPHPEDGLGKWTDAEIKRAITEGISKSGTKLYPPMPYALYAKVTDDDLDAIVAYLRSLKPLPRAN